MFAALYREMAKIGYTPTEVDELEVWQAASLLGGKDAGPGDESGAAGTLENPDETGNVWIQGMAGLK